jgi:predicted Zn-dependent protease
MQMKRELPEYPSKAVQRYAQCIVYAIIDEIPEEFQNLDWEVIVFDSESANAQVLPQGKVAVYSGILRFADTPDKLAAVIGHEVAHLTKGHVGKRVGRGALSTLAGIAGGVATGLGNESQAAANVLFQLPYQREQEIEADLTGMMYAAEAGYNPASVLEIWKDMSEGAERGTGWLQTHPNPELRLRELAQNLSPSLKVYNDALDAGVRPKCHL